jgi:hypothetical protein
MYKILERSIFVKQIRVYSLLFLFAASLATANGVAAQLRILPVNLEWQKTDEWCWASSGQMIMNYIGPQYVPQCYEANQEFGRKDCCACPTPDQCVNPGWPQFSTWNFNSTETPNGVALTWPQLEGQINGNKPFAFAWAWNGGGGHMMVARGYFRLEFIGIDLKWVLVNNPWPPTSRCAVGSNAAGPFGGDIEFDDYSEFVGGPGFDHTHMADIYDISHK